LIKNEEVGVLSTMCSIHNMFPILGEFEQQSIKRNNGKKKTNK
jgi:hypothetical protein